MHPSHLLTILIPPAESDFIATDYSKTLKQSDIYPEFKHHFLSSLLSYCLFQSIRKITSMNNSTEEVFQAVPSNCFPIGADLAQVYSHGVVLFLN